MELTGLVVGDDAAVWSDLGFAVENDACRVGAVEIRFDPSVGKGVRRWSFAGDGPAEIEGLPTEWSSAPGRAIETTEHPNKIATIDHVVLVSPDVDRTIAVFTEFGLAPRRERLTDTYGAPMRQVFFCSGEVILELIGAPDAHGEGSLRIFGLAFTSDDLDATAAHLTGRLHPPKDAVQPGRRIATVDKAAGSTVPIAIMSPEKAGAGHD